MVDREDALRDTDGSQADSLRGPHRLLGLHHIARDTWIPSNGSCPVHQGQRESRECLASR